MLGGYWQKIAVIDLSTETVDYLKPSEDDLKKYIGGSGLGAKLLYENTKPGIDPLGPDNVLICMTGPYVGTKVAQSGRWELITKGPLTGVYLEADCGGKWGGALKACGLDGIMVKGKANKPVYVTIVDNDIQIKKADHLWGKGTFETDQLLKEELGSGSQAISIGQAGEKLVKIASIMTDGREGRTAGRGGGGAVMGSKNLKAIACKGTQKVPIARPEPYEELIKKFRENFKDVYDGPLGTYGTSCAVEIFNDVGDLPIKNWLWGHWDKASKVSGQELAKTILKKRYHCGNCLIGCGRTVEIPSGAFKMQQGGGPEYETLGMLGSNCLIDDVEAVSKGAEYCNDYGIDTISASALISFLMEAWEHGMIDKEDTDGLEMTWGNGVAAIEMIKKIALRDGIGDPCSQGILEAIKRVGPASAEFAVHVKGMDFPAHDPRGRGGLGVAYATSNRGACHMQAYNQDFEGEGCLNIADLGYDAPMPPYTNEGKGKFVADMQNFMSMMDSLKLCKFSVFGGMTVGPMTQFLNHIVGWDLTNEQWIECGERIFNLKRLFNTREGVSRKDDTLPPRILTSPRQGGSGDFVPDLGYQLRDYYRARHWDEWGIPTPETLERLGLDGYEYRKKKPTTEDQR